jgi:hypothetical protein
MTTFPKAAFYSLEQIEEKSKNLRYWLAILQGEEKVSSRNILTTGLFANRQPGQMVESVEAPLVACQAVT